MRKSNENPVKPLFSEYLDKNSVRIKEFGELMKKSIIQYQPTDNRLESRQNAIQSIKANFQKKFPLSIESSPILKVESVSFFYCFFICLANSIRLFEITI